jgi:outer membrane immunogenic protein
MKFRIGILALAILAAFSGRASAADMPVKAARVVPAPAPAMMSWTGWYIGAFVGYHWGNITESGCVGICPSGDDPRIWGAGIQAGYDWHMPNNWVFGLQARIPVFAEHDTVVATGVPFSVKPRFQAFGSARLGYAMGPMGAWLPYVNLGIGVGSNRLSGLGASDTATHVVLGAGAGIEYRLSRNWSVDLRYMYASWLKETYNLGVPGEKFGDNSSNVTLAVNYRFNP